VGELRLIASGLVLLVVAAAAGGLALDVRDVRDGFAAADARFEAGSGRVSWGVDERLPGAPAAALLDVDDDRRFRGALADFRRAAALLDDELRRQEAEGARAAAIRALGPVAAGDGRVAAQANVLLGVLAFDQPDGPERAVASFRNALRLDPANVAAKFDLELALRILRPTGTRPGDSGTGPRSGPARGAGAGEEGGGY
jgi:hypothetical protein